MAASRPLQPPSPPSRVNAGTLRQHWPVVGLLGAIVLWYGPWLVAPEVRMGGDVTTEFYPWLAYAVSELRLGRLPLWGPHSVAGAPLLANPQVGILYPPNWPLLAVVSADRALNLSAILHVALAAGATYALARRWGLSTGAALVGALAYGFNGMVAARLWAGNLNFFQVAAWLPALLLAADALRAGVRWRPFLALWLMLACSLLVGFYQLWYIGGLVVGAYLALMPGNWRERAVRLGLLATAGMLAVGLAAPVLVPATELVGWSTRAGRLTWEFATAASLAPWHLVTLVLPELFGSGNGTYWAGAWWEWHELASYGGILSIVLLPLALRSPRPAWVWFCLGLAVISILLALGRYAPLYGWFYNWVPGYASFRDPGRHLAPASLALALLAAQGAERLLKGVGRGLVLGLLLGVLLLAASAATVLASLSDSTGAAAIDALASWGMWARPPEAELQSRDVLGAAVLLLAARACGMAVIAATLALLAIVLGRRRSATGAAALLAAALLADLTLFGWRYLHDPLPLAAHVPFGPLTAQLETYLGPANVARLHATPGLWRVGVLGEESVIVGNAGYVLGASFATGLDPLLPRRYAEVVALMNQEPVETFQNVALFFRDTRAPLWPLLNVRYWLAPADDTGFTLRDDSATLPRAFTLERWEWRPPGATLAALAEPGFDPRAGVILEGEPATAQPGGAGAGDGRALREPARVTRASAGDYQIELALERAAALVVLEGWHPGWTASTDGAPTRLVPADHAFMALLVPEGRHVVHLQFDPASWRIGLGIGALAALVGMLAALVLARLARRTPRPAAGQA